MRRTADSPTANSPAPASPPRTLATPIAAASGRAVTAAQLGAADMAVGGPAARAGGLSGAGLKIGIISDSFNLSGQAAAEQAAGLLPANGVTVLEEGPAGSGDEGMAMAELVHATAPAAQLYFYSGYYSEQDMAAGVAALRAAGCQIIVDDISYADEPMFQIAGPIDTAVQAAVSAGVDYFTAVGNDGNGVYQAPVAPRLVAIPGLGTVWAQTFAGGASTQSVTIPGGNNTTLSLEWNAPYNAANTDTITVKILSGSTVIATSTQFGSAPVVSVDFPVAFTSRTYSVAILYSSGSGQPGLIKYVLEGGGTIDTGGGGQATGSAYGHTLVPGVNAVGAVDVANTPAEGGTPTPEGFSSTAGSTLLYAPGGAALATPQTTGAPTFLAPDGAATSVYNPFFGTSAAAPVAAAVAALMLQADPSLPNADVTTLLDDSALPVASSDGAAGAGLIQANLATRFAQTGVIAGSPQTTITGISQACTIQGGGGAHMLVAGSGATLIQSQGNDTVQAGAGADTVDLSGAAAALYGGTGATWVRTLGGTDTVVGASGGLTVSGGAGGGVVFGGTGGGNVLIAGQQETIVVARGTADLLGGVGNGDQLYASATGRDTLVGGSGTEFMVGAVGGAAAAGGANVFVAGPGTPVIAPENTSAVITFGTADTTAVMGTANTLLDAVNGQAGGDEWIYGFDPTHDLLLVSGLGGNTTQAQAAIANQYDVGGNSWIKLQDGTVMAFVGLSHLSAGSVTYG